jgi:hypothetical protein
MVSDGRIRSSCSISYTQHKKNKYRGWSQMEGLEVPAPLATLNIRKTNTVGGLRWKD